MINLKQLLTEDKKVKIKFRKVLPGGKDASRDVEFSVYMWDGPRVIFLPKSSKDLDKLDELDFTINFEKILNKIK